MTTSEVRTFWSGLLGMKFSFARVWGVKVSIHWTWFVCLVVWVWVRGLAYSSWGWAAAEDVGIFLIVLLHEFGHVGMAKWVGVEAEEIVLWPLGGIATVGKAWWWWKRLAIVAGGPVVNIFLMGVFFFVSAGSGMFGVRMRLLW